MGLFARLKDMFQTKDYTAMTAEEMMEVMGGNPENTTEETVETIDNGIAVTGETQETGSVEE